MESISLGKSVSQYCSLPLEFSLYRNFGHCVAHMDDSIYHWMLAFACKDLSGTYRLKIENNWYDEQTRRIRIRQEKETGQ